MRRAVPIVLALLLCLSGALSVLFYLRAEEARKAHAGERATWMHTQLLLAAQTKRRRELEAQATELLHRTQTAERSSLEARTRNREAREEVDALRALLKKTRVDSERREREQARLREQWLKAMAAKPAVRRLNNAATVLNVKDTNVGIFVAISAGTKDRVKLGDKLVVSRNQNRVGTLDIIRVSKDSAIGRFQANNNNAIPQVNDKVGR